MPAAVRTAPFGHVGGLRVIDQLVDALKVLVKQARHPWSTRLGQVTAVDPDADRHRFRGGDTGQTVNGAPEHLSMNVATVDINLRHIVPGLSAQTMTSNGQVLR